MSEAILRKFWLEDENGESRPLNGEKNVWFVNPTGLGISSNNSTTDFGYGFFRPQNEKQDPQQTVAGDLYFIGQNPYEMYKGFIDWALRAKTLWLVYQPINRQYRRRVKIHSMTKTELMTQESLKAPVSFGGLSPWCYAEKSIAAGRLVSIDNTFRLDESELDAGVLEESSDYRVTITTRTDGQLPAAFKIVYNGDLADPKIIVRGLNTGEVYGRCRLENYSKDSTSVFEYSSERDDSHIKMRTFYGDEIDLVDRIASTEFEVYPRISIHEPCAIDFCSGVPIQSDVTFELFNYYKGV